MARALAAVHPRWAPGLEDGYSVIFSLMTSASRGTVPLTSADPDQARRLSTVTYHGAFPGAM